MENLIFKGKEIDRARLISWIHGSLEFYNEDDNEFDWLTKKLDLLQKGGNLTDQDWDDLKIITSWTPDWGFKSMHQRITDRGLGIDPKIKDL